MFVMISAGKRCGIRTRSTGCSEKYSRILHLASNSLIQITLGSIQQFQDVLVDIFLRIELGDSFKFVKENMVCKVCSYKGKVFAVEPPNFVELEVTETDPGFKGDTATNVTKPAKLETGCEVKVPLFINPGDRIRIDTRVGEYLERAK